MRKLIGVLLLSGLLIGSITFASAQTPGQDEPRMDPPKKQFGSGAKPDTKPKPPVKSFGSGDKPKPKEDPKPPVKSFGSGDKLKEIPHVTPPKTGPPTKSFGSGDKDKHSTDAGGKPKGSFDNKAAIDQRKVESKNAFIKGTAPAATYVDPKGKTVQIDPRDAKIAHLRNQLNEEKWHNRDLRERNFYSTYYSRPVIVYHDPYNSFFWYWMLDRSIEQQAMWAYNHRYSMDAARYNDMLARNAELAARVRALEGSGAVRNQAYQPAGMADPDLMYQKDYVQAAYNPQPVPHVVQHEDSGHVLQVLLFIFLGLAIVALVVWLVFVKKW